MFSVLKKRRKTNATVLKVVKNLAKDSKALYMLNDCQCESLSVSQTALVS